MAGKVKTQFTLLVVTITYCPSINRKEGGMNEFVIYNKIQGMVTLDS